MQPDSYCMSLASLGVDGAELRLAPVPALLLFGTETLGFAFALDPELPDL